MTIRSLCLAAALALLAGCSATLSGGPPLPTPRPSAGAGNTDYAHMCPGPLWDEGWCGMIP